MGSESGPYENFTAGQLISAELMNGLQCKIKEDIKNQVTGAIDALKEAGVERADNADKFDEKSPDDWTGELDEHYAAKIHDHEGKSGYRRYIKRFDQDLDKALLEHKLGRFPLVDVYELEDVVDTGQESDLKLTKEEKERYKGCKLIFYYGHKDAKTLGLDKRVFRKKVRLGIPFEQILTELGVDYQEDQVIEDLLNDMWEAFCKDPNDEIKHCTTPWVDDCCGKQRTVKLLKDGGQWSDLYVAMLPAKCGMGVDFRLRDLATRGNSKNTPVRQPADGREVQKSDIPDCQLEVVHPNYDSTFVQINGLVSGGNANDDIELCLMFLLRS